MNQEDLMQKVKDALYQIDTADKYLFEKRAKMPQYVDKRLSWYLTSAMHNLRTYLEEIGEA